MRKFFWLAAAVVVMLVACTGGAADPDMRLRIAPAVSR